MEISRPQVDSHSDYTILIVLERRTTRKSFCHISKFSSANHIPFRKQSAHVLRKSIAMLELCCRVTLFFGDFLFLATRKLDKILAREQNLFRKFLIKLH